MRSCKWTLFETFSQLTTNALTASLYRGFIDMSENPLHSTLQLLNGFGSPAILIDNRDQITSDVLNRSALWKVCRVVIFRHKLDALGIHEVDGCPSVMRRRSGVYFGALLREYHLIPSLAIVACICCSVQPYFRANSVAWTWAPLSSIRLIEIMRRFVKIVANLPLLDCR